MFVYNVEALRSVLESIIRANLPPDAFAWLENEVLTVRKKSDIAKFNIAFVAMPRKTGKALIRLSRDEQSKITTLREGLDLRSWTTDRLCRVWLLMHPDASSKEKYTSLIENLFINAEMGELVALYSALPVLAYPEAWKKRCAEGIRSNIGEVLEAIICNNPYPSEQLDESAWNQMVLKAIFTEKPVLAITGLLERRNRKLADSLSDYAHERWAASRPLNPLLWICVGPFIDETNFPDIQRLFSSHDSLEREAAALVCYESSYPPAQKLLEQKPELQSSIERGDLGWSSIEHEMEKAERDV